MNNDYRFFIGAPVLTSDRKGYIVSVEKELIMIVWNGGGIHYISCDRIEDVSTMINLAFNNGMQRISDLEASTKHTDEIMSILESKSIFEKNQVETARLNREWDELMKKTIPCKYKSVIVAKKISREMQLDDYIKETTHDTVILCLSESARDNFKEMRKAAMLSEKTAFLFKSGLENREKYSGGKGYYLSETDRGTGWIIQKRFFFNGVPSVPVGELSAFIEKQMTKETQEIKAKEDKKTFSISEMNSDEVFHISSASQKHFRVTTETSMN